MAFSTKIQGNHHVQGNVQVYNVRNAVLRSPTLFCGRRFVPFGFQLLAAGPGFRPSTSTFFPVGFPRFGAVQQQKRGQNDFGFGAAVGVLYRLVCLKIDVFHWFRCRFINHLPGKPHLFGVLDWWFGFGFEPLVLVALQPPYLRLVKYILKSLRDPSTPVWCNQC